MAKLKKETQRELVKQALMHASQMLSDVYRHHQEILSPKEQELLRDATDTVFEARSQIR